MYSYDNVFAAMYSCLLAAAVPAYHLSSLAQQKLLSNIVCIYILEENLT